MGHRTLLGRGGIAILSLAAVLATACNPMTGQRGNANSQWDPGGAAIIDLIWHGLEGVDSAHYRLTYAEEQASSGGAPPFHSLDATEGYVDFAHDRYHVTLSYEWDGESAYADEAGDACLAAFPESPAWESIAFDGRIYDGYDAIPPGSGQVWVESEYHTLPIEHGPAAVFFIDLYSAGATGLFPRGKETVHGVETTHYRVTYNVSESYSNDGEVEDWEREVVERYAAFTFEADVWLDAHDRVRRLTYTEMLKTDWYEVPDDPGGDELPPIGRTYTLDVFAYDEDFPIAPPPGEPVDEDTYWEAYDAWWEECYAELEEAGEPVVQAGR